jgi:hypothetical protein
VSLIVHSALVTERYDVNPARPVPSTKTVELMRKYKRIGMSEELFSRRARSVEKDCKTLDNEMKARPYDWLEMYRRLGV